MGAIGALLCARFRRPCTVLLCHMPVSAAAAGMSGAALPSQQLARELEADALLGIAQVSKAAVACLCAAWLTVGVAHGTPLPPFRAFAACACHCCTQIPPLHITT